MSSTTDRASVRSYPRRDARAPPVGARAFLQRERQGALCGAFNRKIPCHQYAAKNRAGKQASACAGSQRRQVDCRSYGRMMGFDFLLVQPQTFIEKKKPRLRRKDWTRVYLKTPNAPGQRAFLRCAASFFLEIRQYSCEKMSCATQKSLAAGHIMSFQIHPRGISELTFSVEYDTL